MYNPNDSAVTQYLHSLVGKRLSYCIKSPDTELYDFGFLDDNDEANALNELTLHALCCFKIIIHQPNCKSCLFESGTSLEKVKRRVSPLIGLAVKRVALSDKNDLWIDLGDYWLVFITYENSKESWRLFNSNSDEPHLVVADDWIDL